MLVYACGDKKVQTFLLDSSLNFQFDIDYINFTKRY